LDSSPPVVSGFRQEIENKNQRTVDLFWFFKYTFDVLFLFQQLGF